MSCTRVLVVDDSAVIRRMLANASVATSGLADEVSPLSKLADARSRRLATLSQEQVHVS